MKILLAEKEIHAGIERLSKELNSIYGSSPITVVSIMTGSVVLLADLIRRLEMPLRISLIQASSYRGGMSSGDLVIQDQMMLDICGRDVLLLDDIFDTGKTLKSVSERMLEMKPRSIRTAVFLSKQGNEATSLRPDHVMFEIPNEFVVGYGLDYKDYYRNLPHVAVLEESDLERFAAN